MPRRRNVDVETSEAQIVRALPILPIANEVMGGASGHPSHPSTASMRKFCISICIRAKLTKITPITRSNHTSARHDTGKVTVARAH